MPAEIEYGTVMTEAVVRKFDEAFALGLTDRQACVYAGNIPYSTFTSWLEKNEDYRIRKEALKENPKIRAKMNIIVKINEGDSEISKWYLERTSKDEFSLKQEVASTNVNVNQDITMLSPEERKKRIAELKQKLGDSE